MRILRYSFKPGSECRKWVCTTDTQQEQNFSFLVQRKTTIGRKLLQYICDRLGYSLAAGQKFQNFCVLILIFLLISQHTGSLFLIHLFRMQKGTLLSESKTDWLTGWLTDWLITDITVQVIFLKDWKLLSYQIICSMKPIGLLQCSQNPTTLESYCDQIQPCHTFTTHFIMLHFNIVMWRSCMTIRRGLDWVIQFIDILYTPLRTTGNYSALIIPTLYRSLLHTPVSSFCYTLH
jgi:hypothetical protein